MKKVTSEKGYALRINENIAKQRSLCYRNTLNNTNMIDEMKNVGRLD